MAWFQIRYGGELQLPVHVATVAQFVVDHAESRPAAGDQQLPPAHDARLVAAGIKARLGPLAQLPLPFNDLRRMQLEMPGQLRQRFVLAQRGHGYLGFERRRVSAAGAPIGFSRISRVPMQESLDGVVHSIRVGDRTHVSKPIELDDMHIGKDL
ncbi:MAG: integrase [Ramlibacter sp.]|nr:integrase [Ramlibacter sp.]